MKLGIMSDSEDDKQNAIPSVVQEFLKRKVDVIIHCGDIEPQHLDAKLFGNLPVFCALNADQVDDPRFKDPPPGWKFTVPTTPENKGSRIIEIKVGNEAIKARLGHKLSFNFMVGQESDFSRVLDEIRKDFDGVKIAFGGHVHHQLCFQSQSLIEFLCPGAVSDSLYGGHHEFAIVDTNKKGKKEIIFGRILSTKPIEESFSIGFVSDTGKVSKFDVDFYRKLAIELKERDARTLIHCGNIAESDIGRPELKDFEVFYILETQQKMPKSIPPNWHLVDNGNPIVDVQGYQFLIQKEMTTILLDNNEFGIRRYIEGLKKKYPSIDFILCGCTQDALFLEQFTKILNPGSVFSNRRFAVGCFPRGEITLGHVPTDPLPNPS